MADPKNGASSGTFAAGVARLNNKEHWFGRTDSRATLKSLQDKQFPGFKPDSPDASSLMKKRNAGRKLSSIPDMQKVHKKLSGGKTLSKPPAAYAYSGSGAAFVDPAKSFSSVGGRPSAINHEFEHAYAQPAETHFSAREIAPVLGDVVFGAEAFRRQAGKPLEGKIPYGFKNQDAEWMRQQASEHGYFDGRSMTDLLRTPEGQSYLRQAALGPQSSANASGGDGSFDPLAPNRPDLPYPDKPINLPDFPDDGRIPDYINNIRISPTAQDAVLREREASVKRKDMLRRYLHNKKQRQELKNQTALRSVFPPPQPTPPPDPRENITVPLSMQATIGSPLSGDLSKSRRLERVRMGMLDASSPFYSGGISEATRALEPFERKRFPGQTEDALVPVDSTGSRNIRGLLGKYEDNPMGGYSTPTQSILFPFYRRNQGILENARARYGD